MMRRTLMDTAPIRCDHFELVLFSLAFIDALLAGDLAAAERELDVRFPDEDSLPDAQQMPPSRRADLLRDPSVRPWITRAMILPDRRMAGYTGFHGARCGRHRGVGLHRFRSLPPPGFAYEAAHGMMDWARTEHGVRRFRVAISSANGPSLGMAAKLGFARTGEQMERSTGLSSCSVCRSRNGERRIGCAADGRAMRDVVQQARGDAHQTHRRVHPDRRRHAEMLRHQPGKEAADRRRTGK